MAGKIKIVRFIGGLGNQMFQYVLYKALEQRGFDARADLSCFELYKRHNGFELYVIFKIRMKMAERSLIRLFDGSHKTWILRFIRRITGLRKALYKEASLFKYNKEVFSERHTLLSGYWQHLRYLQECEQQIRRDFSFSEPQDEINREYLRLMRSANSVAVHVRRGDYVGDPLLGGICSIDYYTRAIEYVSNKLDTCHFFIFSNDLEWCKRHLILKGRVTFVTGNSGSESYRDMQLMSACNHNIIANSSFSWWAAWLNPNADKMIVCPSTWVNGTEFDASGLMPDEWKKI